MVDDVRRKPETGNRTTDELINAYAVILKGGRLAGKRTVLSVLAGMSDESDFMTRLADDPDGTLKEYYTLTQEEKAALASGDIEKIENWVGKMDKCLSSWLLFRLSRER
jgi:hypothetical protein